MTLATGQVLNNRYRVVRLLGQGGFGAVYRAWDVNLSIPCAVKESFGTGSTDSTRQFAREANILASLRHTNLPKVTDYFSIPDQGQYLVMEFIDGENLEEKLEKAGSPLPENKVVNWAVQILQALVYLHSQFPPIIHRDIKPANIRVTPQGQAILVDFGIAKFFDPVARTTLGARAITPGYSPFEQYGQAPTDARSDIYALGATMFHLLTCLQPPESIQRMINDSLPELHQLAPQLSPGVCTAIMKAMQPDPNRRWQKASDFLAALVEAANTSPARLEDHTVLVIPEAGQVALSAVEAPLPGTEVVSPGDRGTQPPLNPVKPKAAGKGFSRSCLIAGGAVLLALFACAGVVVLASLINGNTSQKVRETQFLAQATTTLPEVPAAAPLLSTALPATATGGPTIIGPYATSVVNVPTLAVSAPLPGEPVKIGLLAPLTGQVPTFGVSVKEGAELAIAEWNANNKGMFGRPVELVVYDSQCSANVAADAAIKLIDQEGVRFIIGDVCSSASIPVAEIVNQKGVLQISPTSTNPRVTVDEQGNVRSFSFRACFIDPFQGQVMAKFAMERGDKKTAFIMYDKDNDYSRGLVEAFDKVYRDLGGQIVGRETYSAQETDFTGILKMVQDSKAEVLYLPDYYNIVNLVAAQAKKMGVQAVLAGGDGWDSADLDLNAIGEGFYTNHYDPGDTNPAVVDWVKRYGAAYQQDGQSKVPDALATLSYDAVYMLLSAMAKTGMDDPAQVRDTLAIASWDAITGPISFDSNHNPIKSAVIIQIAKGQKSFFTTISP